MDATRNAAEQVTSVEASGASSPLSLEEIIDIAAVQKLMEGFHSLTGFLMALLDLEGRVLIAMGWQDVCTQFHRVDPECCENCRESDLMLTRGVPRGEFRAYKCRNGMWDVVTPLYVDDMHVGNVFVGQFFYDDETPDLEFFARQAEKYGFDRNEYLEAVLRAPRYSHETVDQLMRFCIELTEQIARAGYSNLVLSRAIEDRRLHDLYVGIDRAVLEILNQPIDLAACLQRVVTVFKESTGADAVGIRLRDGDDFPYIAQSGFSMDHMRSENCLVQRDAHGEAVRDDHGRAVLECSCGLVLAGSSDPSLTPWGSMWTGDSRAPGPALMPDARINPRDTCVAEGYGSIAIVPIRDTERIVGLLHIAHRAAGCLTLEIVEQLEGVAVHIGEAMTRKDAEAALVQTNIRLERVLVSITETMGKVIEARDPYTQGHQTRVARLSRLIGAEMGLAADDLDEVEIAALVHDIGKLSIPSEILTKPGRLSEVEMQLVREHSRVGFEMLQHIDFGRPIAQIVRQHHERMDGSGYPDGIEGDEVLVPSRILMAADVIEAMATHRPYRVALGYDAALEELQVHAERFDRDVIAACVSLHGAGRLVV